MAQKVLGSEQPTSKIFQSWLEYETELRVDFLTTRRPQWQLLQGRPEDALKEVYKTVRAYYYVQDPPRGPSGDDPILPGQKDHPSIDHPLDVKKMLKFYELCDNEFGKGLKLILDIEKKATLPENQVAAYRTSAVRDLCKAYREEINEQLNTAAISALVLGDHPTDASSSQAEVRERKIVSDVAKNVREPFRKSRLDWIASRSFKKTGADNIGLHSAHKWMEPTALERLRSRVRDEYAPVWGPMLDFAVESVLENIAHVITMLSVTRAAEKRDSALINHAKLLEWLEAGEDAYERGLTIVQEEFRKQFIWPIEKMKIHGEAVMAVTQILMEVAQKRNIAGITGREKHESAFYHAAEILKFCEPEIRRCIRSGVKHMKDEEKLYTKREKLDMLETNSRYMVDWHGRIGDWDILKRQPKPVFKEVKNTMQTRLRVKMIKKWSHIDNAVYKPDIELQQLQEEAEVEVGTALKAIKPNSGHSAIGKDLQAIKKVLERLDAENRQIVVDTTPKDIEDEDLPDLV